MKKSLLIVCLILLANVVVLGQSAGRAGKVDDGFTWFEAVSTEALGGFAHKVGCHPKILEGCSCHDPISSTHFDFMGKAGSAYPVASNAMK